MKIAVIGGSGGLGKQLIDVFSKDEADNLVISTSSKSLDVRNFQKCKEFFYNYEVDVLINLSGVNFDKMIHKIEQKDQYLINHLLDVNLHGTINLVSACLPGMRDRGFGRIILISSILSTKDVPGTSIYSSCKAFIDKFVKNTSVENIGKGITCNSLQLGYFDGGMTNKVPDNEKIKGVIPLKRWGSIQELYKAIEFLIKTEYITGTNIPLTGGL